ncbi:MAG: Asp23/Gls24 family envelope stress response protein [Herpetosiphon sp.]|nr:Asp23/Gls24 family envelope stress response protein [Herpetosiphon sp.]
MTTHVGNVTIAPDVLSTIVSLTAQDVEGVARLGSVPNQQRVGSMLASSNASSEGVAVRIVEDSVMADCYVVAKPHIQLLELGERVQLAVQEALNEMVGMPVRSVNVYIQDVEQSRE